jgi:hypothetical protein
MPSFFICPMSLSPAPPRQPGGNNVRDFRPLHADAVTPGGSGHFGMIFMSGNYKRTKNDIGRILADLEAKLVQYPGDEDLVNAEDWL